MKRSIIYFLAIIVAVSCKFHPTKNDINKIGVIIPESGNSAAWGKQARDAIELAADLYKDSISFNFIYQDSRGINNDAINAANYLIVKEKIRIIIGDMMSSTTLQIAPICEKNKIILISPVASSPKLGMFNEYVFKLWPSDDYEARFTAEWLMKNDLNTTSIVYLNDEFGKPLEQKFSDMYRKMGGTIIDSIGYNSSEIDFRNSILKLKRKTSKAVYLISHYSDGANFVKQAYESNMSTRIIGTADLKNEVFIRLTANSSENIVFPSKTGFSPEGESVHVQSFVNNFQKRFGRIPGMVEAQVYDAAVLAIRSLINMNTNNISIKKFLNDVNFEGVSGRISFDNHGELISPAFEMNIIKNGKIERISDIRSN